MRRLYVNVYELDREYGGPEEGGWWVTTGTPVKDKKPKVCRSLKQAFQWRTKLEDDIAEKMPDPRYSLGSVLYSGGEYVVMVEEHPAKRWPDPFPRYE